MGCCNEIICKYLMSGEYAHLGANAWTPRFSFFFFLPVFFNLSLNKSTDRQEKMQGMIL